MSWKEIDPRSIDEHDLVRAYRGEFDRIEGVAQVDDEGDRYLRSVGMLSNQYLPDNQGDAIRFGKWTKFEKWYDDGPSSLRPAPLL